MNRKTRVMTAAIALLATSATAFGFTGDQYAKQAKVSIEQARATALKARPGKITDEELEKESGGSGIRYSFDIASARGTQEVGVDAQTGAVLENKAEGWNPD
ncbi:PepSY domain containing protein [Burkholderia sp. MR1]|nr:PepSY domain containing protein [Burkholderia sp. MR1]